MMVAFLSRAFLMVLGYAYPAYECYKTVEMNKPEIEQLRFWCQYWLPMYSEAKLAFYVYLWYPKTKGTKYIYDTFFQPYVAKHETEIDRCLLDLKTRMGDIAALCWQKAVNYGQTRFFEIMQYVTSGSLSQTQQRRSPHPVQELQQQQQQQQTQEPTTPKRQEPPAPPVPPSPTKSRLQDRTTARNGSSLSKPPKSSPSYLRRRTEAAASRDASEEQAAPQANTIGTSANINGSQETTMEEASHKTRGRLRKLAPISGTTLFMF